MASDLSSGCNESLEVLDEKEEGEISLEDVSSSEEGHISYGYGIKIEKCINCLSTQRCAPWCTSAKYYHHKSSIRKDTVQEKENRHYAKDSGSAGVKHSVSTLQEKNDDLVPISSDSDMEIVGLADNSQQKHSMPRYRSKKKKKKERNHVSSTDNDNLVSSSSTISVVVGETTLKHDNDNSKVDRLSRSHRRDLSPLHRRSRISNKSPSRRRRSSTWFKMPYRKSKSPIMRSRSPVVLRESPRRLRSPKRSVHRSPSSRAISKKMSKKEQLPSSDAFNDNAYGDVNKLLEKVRLLDSIRVRVQEENVKSKEHCPSLKKKLSNMMKGKSDNNDNVTNFTKEKMVTYMKVKNDADDEEDLALLRQKALETKQKRNEKNNEQQQIKTESESKTSSYVNDHNEEDLTLRMLALRSAVLNKHKNRVERGIKTKKHDSSSISRSKSPFDQSFLDSISIPGETHVDSLPPPPPAATEMLFPSNEMMHTEDMELDTDIEQEKEKMPYSPTDNITNDIPIDTHLLGMQTSDVSFINLNKRTNGSPFDNTNNQLEHGALRTGIIENKSYLSNMINCANTESTFYDINTDAPYSPSDSIETSKSDVITAKQSNEYISTSQFSVTHGNMTNDISSTNVNVNDMAMDISMGQERPYSPTDAPIYDPDLSQTLPLTQTSFSKTSNNLMSSAMYDHSYENVNILKGENQQEKEQVNEMENLITRNQNDSSHFFEEGSSLSPNDSMVTIDDLSNADQVDPEICLSSNLGNKDNMNNNPTDKDTKLTEEPLYMHGVPDVTKDINKIPTLINKTLVPATILKSNKQLQQPWPMKKHENYIEPTFKSAEMQPIPMDVNVNTKLTTQFKPMKLTSVVKKPQTILTTPVAFKNCLSDESITEDTHRLSSSKEQETSSNTSLNKSEINVLSNITDLLPKKRKRERRRRSKRKNNNSIENITITISNENTKKLENNCGASEETNVTVTSVESELPSNDIHKEQNNTSDVAILNDSDNVKLTKLNQESHSHLSNKIEKDNNVQHLINVESNNNSSLNVVENRNKRRPSIDEDEEELRASLLASLKRSKSSDNSSCSISSVTTTATLSSTSNVPPVIQKVQQMDIAIPTYQVQSPIPHSLSQSTIVYNPGDDKSQQVNSVSIPSSTDIVKENVSGNDTTTASRLTYMTNCNKKRPLPLLKGPTKKYVKKVSIPASTKVVNNAKKYQNTVVQKKLILQKTISNYKADKMLDNKPIVSIRPCENKWISNTKVISSDMQRIVINLGSDSEESDSDYERYQSNSISMSNSNKVEKRPILNIPTTEFERSVDQFLRDVRKKQETAAASKHITTTTTMASSHKVTKKNLSSGTSTESNMSSSVHTPSAVRHLPVSQQEEYRRLKQQILEREILQKKRTAESGTSKTTNNINNTSSHSTMSDNLSKEALPLSKENPVGFEKTQNVNLKISIKNNNERNIEVIKRNTNSSSTSSVIINSEKKPPLQVIVSNPSNARTSSNEQSSDQSNQIMKKTTESNQSLMVKRQISENTNPQDRKKCKIAKQPSLKVLTMDEVNHKFIQIQINQHESDRTIMINNEKKQDDNNVNKKKDDKIDVDFGQNHAKEDNKMIKDNYLDTSSCTVSKENEQEMSKDKDQLIMEDMNNLDTLNVDLSIEDENVHNKEMYLELKDQLLPPTLVQDDETAEKDTNTDINVSNIIEENSHENDLILATNEIEINEMQDFEELKKEEENIEKDVTEELNSLVDSPKMEEGRHLIDAEYKLVTERYMVVDKLTEMLEDLREWNMERNLKRSSEEEIKKLKEQLRLAEIKLREHVNKINSIGPKVMDARNKINNGRRECFKLSKICKVLGTRVMGEHYEIPTVGKDILENKLKEVINHSRQFSQKKVPSSSVHVSEMHTNIIPEKQTEPELENELESESQPEHEPESESQPEPEPEFHIEPEPEPAFQIEIESESQPEPESEFQTESEPMEIETPILSNFVVMEQQDDDHFENDNIMISENDNNTVETLTNTQESLKQGDGEEETIEESRKKDSNLSETNDIIRHDHFYDKTRTEGEYCINLTGNNGDSDIIYSTTTTTRMKVLQEVDDQRRRPVEPYVSMLTHLKPSRNSNPHGILCPYELMGTCNDGDCRFVHQSVIIYDQSMEDKTLKETQDCIDLDAVHFDHPSRSNA
ncbi:PREDICTED: putative leucine-rich repeat-containing protein DDB_G0290503 [Polistes dominula]|uniref:Leucine-rich repeat-containing protein DDB_G0290503 n=1 Tax=Polistes dominula TaxID=743375 RepID=A0ABM1IDP1_POLDO|nr:PREDICTED: putative leucine-rich repeat-containing protein DDB_G0290503 [Polistes dominula]